LVANQAGELLILIEQPLGEAWAVRKVPLVHVIDDHAEIRESLGMLLESVAIDAATYATAEEFLATYDEAFDRQDILLLDVRMPGISGMVLLEQLRAVRPALPIIMITGHGDIDMAVRAMKLGAIDFITKPISSQALLDVIQGVLRRLTEDPRTEVSVDDAVARYATLTARERQVFEHIVAGESNKVIAIELGINSRTVESHRASLMKKMQVKNLVDLVLLSLTLKQARP
jgi:FixJ family two-component response regulator